MNRKYQVITGSVAVWHSGISIGHICGVAVWQAGLVLR